MALTFDALRTMLSARQYKAVYLLHGEEGYYIDRLVEDFEKIIPEDERDFNMHVFYAPRVEPDTVMSVCRQAPFGVERSVGYSQGSTGAESRRTQPISSLCGRAESADHICNLLPR